MYKGVIAFITLQLVALGIVGNYPALVNYLPNRVSLTSDTAPPPLNPKLQYCMEEYVADQFNRNGDRIRQAIANAEQLDFSYLPQDLQSEIDTAFEKAKQSFELLAAAKQAEAAIEMNSVAYRPLHSEVREIQNQALLIETKIAVTRQNLRRAEPDSPLKEARETRIENLTAELDALLATIPPAWDAAHKSFLTFTKAERTARTTYRKAVDDAYAPIVELRAIIADAEALEALGAAVTALQADVPGLEFDEGMNRIESVEKQLGDLAGTRDIRSLLAKARRAIKGRTPNPEEAAQFLSEAAVAFDEDVAWRNRAVGGLKNGLAEYEAAIRDTIGLRGQPRLPEEQALFVASCSAGHKDISLSF
jgi:predicted  nucleic acid-binding Zn-ribbon protein